MLTVIGRMSADQAKTQQEESYHSLSYAYKTYLRHDKEEQNHWEDVCRAYRQYATFAMAQWASHQYRLHSLPEEQRKVLPARLRRDTPDFHARAKAYKEAAIRNQFCLDCILRHAGQPHSQEYSVGKHSTDAQMSKVSSVLKSLARDWSADGKSERDMAYQPILAQVTKHVPMKDPRPRICVPGAGVGRLALELCSLGYTVQGNEFSLFMLLASDFILNGGIATPSAPMNLSPWLLETRNVHHSTDPMRVVQIPDVDPFQLILGDDADRKEAPPNDFSMAAGEFVSIYSNPKEKGQWDAVVACFFLDASPSIVEYLQVIHDMLKPGGVLVNFGPLLWHWSGPAMRPDDKTVEDYFQRYSYLDKKYLTSVDLSLEDVKDILENVGFDIVEVETSKRALYTADQRSMMNMDYRCASFVAKKKGPNANVVEPAEAVTGAAVAPTDPKQEDQCLTDSVQ